MAVATFYFDASDASITDPNGVWTNESNAADSLWRNSASSSSVTTNTADYIQIDGVNAPSITPSISQVRIRNLIGTTPSYTNYVTATPPTGGWTWAAVAGLESRSHYDPDVSGKVRTSVYADGTAGGTALATSSTTGGGTGGELYMIEVEVTFNASEATCYFDGSGGTSDPNSAWTSTTNAFDSSDATSSATITVGSKSLNYLEGIGTNLLPFDGDILVVQARVRYNNGSTTLWSSYLAVNAPGGSWSASEIDSLVSRSFKVDANNGQTEIYASGDGGGTALAALSFDDNLGDPFLYKIELLVSYNPTATTAWLVA